MQSTFDQLGEQIAEDVAHIDAALHRVLTKLRAYDASGNWCHQGFRSCAAWLSWRVGWNLRTAREHVRVAVALGRLPAIDNALHEGRLSFSKVRAITRVANGENEQVLLEQALLTTGHQLDTLCRKYASVNKHEAEADPRFAVDRRYVTRRDTDDGMVVIHAVLHPDEGAKVWAALERFATDRCRDNAFGPPAEQPPSAPGPSEEGVSGAASSEAESETDVPVDPHRRGIIDPRALEPRRGRAFDRAEALVAIAEHVLRGSRVDRSPTELVISVPVEALEAPSSSDPLEVACCADGTALSSAAVRRLACDAGFVPLVEDERGNTLAAGRKRRTISGATKRALLHRDRTCRFPGCHSRAFLEGHHIQHWADGGKTTLLNLVSMCSHHHRFVHEYGFTIELRPDGRVVAHDRRGQAIHDNPKRPSPPDLGWENIERRNIALGITPETIECWDGTRVDYSLLIDELVRAEDAASREPT